MKIKLEKFRREHYADLISWVDSEETLMLFGGPSFKFPLDEKQLDDSLSDTNRIAFRVVKVDNHEPIGHCEIHLSHQSAKLARILIGVPAERGKGLGKEIIALLLDFVFNKLHKEKAELNVFDQNMAAIHIYEKAGFVRDPDIRLERKVKGQTWIASNMTISRERYNTKRSLE